MAERDSSPVLRRRRQQPANQALAPLLGKATTVLDMCKAVWQIPGEAKQLTIKTSEQLTKIKEGTTYLTAKRDQCRIGTSKMFEQFSGQLDSVKDSIDTALNQKTQEGYMEERMRAGHYDVVRTVVSTIEHSVHDAENFRLYEKPDEAREGPTELTHMAAGTSGQFLKMVEEGWWQGLRSVFYALLGIVCLAVASVIAVTMGNPTLTGDLGHYLEMKLGLKGMIVLFAVFFFFFVMGVKAAHFWRQYYSVATELKRLGNDFKAISAAVVDFQECVVSLDVLLETIKVRIKAVFHELERNDWPSQMNDLKRSTIQSKLDLLWNHAEKSKNDIVELQKKLEEDQKQLSQ